MPQVADPLSSQHPARAEYRVHHVYLQGQGLRRDRGDVGGTQRDDYDRDRVFRGRRIRRCTATSGVTGHKD